MILHTIFPAHCVNHLFLEGENELRCGICGKWIGTVYDEEVYVRNGYKKHLSKIRESGAVKKHTILRNRLGETLEREWRDFLRDLKFDEDEIYIVEATDEGFSEDCLGKDSVGCEK